jgi:hypothetical protein
MAWGLGVVAGCAAEPFEGETAACRCEAEPGCSQIDCPIEVVLGESCVGQVDFAEVVIDGHIEREVVRPGEVMTACSRIPLAGVARVAARGGEWLWGPLEEGCLVAGQARRLVFDCSEFGDPAGPVDASQPEPSPDASVDDGSGDAATAD